MARDLKDAEWALIQPVLPPPSRRGRPRADDRKTLNGVLWVMRTGAPWNDLPEKYGSDSTCHRRLHGGTRDSGSQAEGVWERIWKTCLRVLDEKGRLDWRRSFIDGTFAPAKKGGLQSA